MASEFSGIFDKIREAITALDLDVLSEIGGFVKDRIVAKARTGRTMASGSEESLKPLSEEYIEFRRNILKDEKKAIRKEYRKEKRVTKGKGGVIDLAARSRAHVDTTFFSPERSNLTLSGQFLESIQITNIDEEKAEITIGPTGSREAKTAQFVKGSSKTPTNPELAEYISKQGRSIWGIDSTTKSRIAIMVKEKIRNRIRENLSKK